VCEKQFFLTTGEII